MASNCEHMPLYFFHFAGTDEISVVDDEGTHLDGLAAVAAEAEIVAREVIATAVKFGGDVPDRVLVVTDQKKLEVLRLQLRDVLPPKLKD